MKIIRVRTFIDMTEENVLIQDDYVKVEKIFGLTIISSIAAMPYEYDTIEFDDEESGKHFYIKTRPIERKKFELFLVDEGESGRIAYLEEIRPFATQEKPPISDGSFPKVEQ